MKTRKQAATEIYSTMKAYEGDLALSFSTIYRAIYRDGEVWKLTTGSNTSHHNYTA